SPQPLAHIAYDASTGNATLSSWAGPSIVSSDGNANASPDALVRIGLRDPSPGAAWTGILTSARALGAEFKKTLVLHADREGRVYGVGFGAEARVDGPAAADDVVDVRVEKVRAGPAPVLNKPVVLDEAGKVKGQQVEEKSFLQKYWWVLALFLVMQLAAGG
ncbi:uncharacterized protein K452DRAFT_193952, partial [Aplosporella prunicola CBS 121167]